MNNFIYQIIFYQASVYTSLNVFYPFNSSSLYTLVNKGLLSNYTCSYQILGLSISCVNVDCGSSS